MGFIGKNKEWSYFKISGNSGTMLDMMKLLIVPILTVISLFLFQPMAAAEDQYEFEKIVLGKWGDKPGEIGLGQDPTVEHGIGAVMPNDIDVDPAGNLYVVDQVNSRVQVFGPDNRLKYIVYDESQKEWLSYVTGMVVSKNDEIYLFSNKNSYQGRQFGLVRDRKFSIIDLKRRVFDPEIKKTCNDKLILELSFIDKNLNKISKALTSYVDGDGNYYEISHAEDPIGERYFRKYDPTGLMLYSRKVPDSNAVILGVDSADNIYLSGNASSNLHLYKYNKEGKILVMGNLNSHKEITFPIGLKMSCNGDIYLYATYDNSYKKVLKKGQYEVFRLRFQDHSQ